MKYLILVTAVLATIAPANAQTLYGSLIGNVVDPSGASVIAAKVQVINTANGFLRASETSARGIYLFSDLPPGKYELKVSAPSFANFTQTGIAISVNAMTRVDVQPQLSTVAESVTVGALVAMLQTDRADVRAEITSRQLLDLPLSGNRNYQSLFRLIPGMSRPRLDGERQRHLAQHQQHAH